MGAYPAIQRYRVEDNYAPNPKLRGLLDPPENLGTQLPVLRVQGLTSPVTSEARKAPVWIRDSVAEGLRDPRV